MNTPIDDDPDLALAIRWERIGVLTGLLADLQFADEVDLKKIQSVALFLDQEYRDAQQERDYFSQERQAERGDA